MPHLKKYDMFHILYMNWMYKVYEDQQKHFNFTDVLLLYYHHQYVSASHVAIAKMISFMTRTYL